MYNELDEEKLNQVREYTNNTDYGELQLNDNAYSLIEDLLAIIERIKEEFEDYKNREDCDYDPEIEVPEIHGKGISF